LRQVATIVTPETLRRWHRQLVARKYFRAPLPATECAGRDPPLGRADGGGEPDLGVHADPRPLKNVGHRVGRSTIARILNTQGLPPVPERPTSSSSPSVVLPAQVLDNPGRPYTRSLSSASSC
jgi:putative transposase